MSESALVQELRALAGVTSGDTFDVRYDSVTIKVVYSGGSSSSLTMSLAYDAVAKALPGASYRESTQLASIRPMVIALRVEGDTERMGKSSGEDVEIQTDDLAFDRKVYVDTQTPASVVLQVLSPDVRRAVLDLFELELTSVIIDNVDGNVVAAMTSFTSVNPPAEPGRRAIDAFARLANGLPRVAKLEGEHAKHPLAAYTTPLGALVVVELIVAIPVYFVTTPQCVDDMSMSQAAGCFGPGLLGVIVGVVFVLPLGLVLNRFTRRYRGRSDSSRESGAFSAFVAISVFIVVATAVGYLAAHAG